MTTPTPPPNDSVIVPSIEELRQIGRDRMLTYFIAYGVTPPDDVDEMARVAHELLCKEAATAADDWDAYLKQDRWVSMDDVLRELGIDVAEGPANEPAA